MEVYLEKIMKQLNSGESKTIIRNNSCIVIIGLTTRGRKPWQEEEDTRKDFRIVLVLQEKFFTSELSKVIQDAILLILLYKTMLSFRATSSNTFIMSDVQPIYIPSSVRDWYREVKIWANDRQYSFCLWIPWTKKHKDPEKIDLNEPRHAQYMHKAWKKHQNTENWVDINLALKKRLKFYQTRSNAIILHETHPAHCIPKVVRMETGEVKNEKVYASPRPPPKISLKHDWMKELGSEVAQRPDGQVVQQSRSFQSNQPNPTPDHDRTATPVDCRDASHAQGARKTRSSDDSKSFNVEDKTNHDRTGTPVVCRDASHAQGHEQSRLNEVDIDFRIPGLPHSVLKQAENSRVRELVKKIEKPPSPTFSSTIRQRKWFRTWATWSCLNCSRRTLRRSAKNAYHTGVKASSIAHAGISWKKLQPTEASLNIHWTFSQFQSI